MRHIAMALALLAGLASPAMSMQSSVSQERIAQRSRMLSAPETADPDDARRFGHEVSACTVERQRAAATHYLLLPASANIKRETTRMLRKMDASRCLGTELAFTRDIRIIWSPDTLRYVLADALVRKDIDTNSLTDLDRVAKLTHPVQNRTSFRRRIAADELFRELSIAGECVVRADPANARRLLRSDPTTQMEEAAFAALAVALHNCVAADLAAQLDKSLLRGAVAYNYYRLANAPRLRSASARTSLLEAAE